MNLIDRVNGTQQTIDKFYGQPFKWGVSDCGQLAGQHLEALGIKTQLGEVGSYKTERGAKLALKRLGATSMEDVVDQLGFERIAPASATVGDIVGFPGGSDEKPWTALGVLCSSDHILAFADPEQTGEARGELGPVHVCTVAWRVA